jgi:hypothetical protein
VLVTVMLWHSVMDVGEADFWSCDFFSFSTLRGRLGEIGVEGRFVFETMRGGVFLLFVWI